MFKIDTYKVTINSTIRDYYTSIFISLYKAAKAYKVL